MLPLTNVRGVFRADGLDVGAGQVERVRLGHFSTTPISFRFARYMQISSSDRRCSSAIDHHVTGSS